MSLRSLDVGFDLRLHPEIVAPIPEGTTCVRYDSPGPVYAPREISGQPHRIVETLRANGYRVSWDGVTTHPDDHAPLSR
jgi:hypothetical protein